MKFDGFAYRMSPTLKQVMVARNSVKRVPGQCQYFPALHQFNVPTQLPDHCYGPAPTSLGNAGTDAPFAMIIGDSYGGATADSFMQVLAGEGWRSAKITVSGCAALPGFNLMGDQLQCAKAFDRIKGIVTQQKPDLLIVVNRYNFLFNDRPFDNGEGGSGTLGPFGTISHDRLGPNHSLQERAAVVVSSGVKLLSELAPNITIIYPIPEAGWYVPHLFERQKARGVYQGAISIASDLYWRRNQAAVTALDSARSDNVIKLDPYRLFCDRPDFPGRCLHALGDQLFYGDTNHLTKTGADILAEALRPVLQGLH
ncbi:MAG: SGNH hydrolase domain-containing protein [Alphaproteobacteria bacterium]